MKHVLDTTHVFHTHTFAGETAECRNECRPLASPCRRIKSNGREHARMAWVGPPTVEESRGTVESQVFDKPRQTRAGFGNDTKTDKDRYERLKSRGPSLQDFEC